MYLPIPEWHPRWRTAFAMLLALVVISESTALAFYSIRIGHGEERQHFLGSDDSDDEESGDMEGGMEIAYPKSLTELLEVAHPHGFGFVMFYALIAFLAASIPVADRVYRWWLCGFGLSILLFLAMPFIIRFVWSGAAGGYAVMGALISLHVYGFVGGGIWALRQPVKVTN